MLLLGILGILLGETWVRLVCESIAIGITSWALIG